MYFDGKAHPFRQGHCFKVSAALLGIFALACFSWRDVRSVAMRAYAWNSGAACVLTSGGNTAITVVVRNVSDRLYTDEEDIDGRGEVFNGSEQLLARFAQIPVERLVAGEEATIATWQGVLEEGTYLMRWTTPRHGGVELEFTLLKRFGVLEVGAYRERQIAPDSTNSP